MYFLGVSTLSTRQYQDGPGPQISDTQELVVEHVFNHGGLGEEGHGTRLPPRDVIDGCTVLIIVSRLAPIFTTLFPVLFLRTLAGNVLVGECIDCSADTQGASQITYLKYNMRPITIHYNKPI